ncbi:hypothetical protein ALC62_11465 [Cyphomyrmex costatus]|uniref:Uncharacterized protein n=1 Tax=Cyphomyrmex costatus TaxID=456900 RepID=A0A151ICM3_9HYME|nr:hypothetical protein ALC62_11465 [Cyphomyrmex costatus]
MKKREMRRVLRSWRRGEVEGNDYRKVKKEYKRRRKLFESLVEGVMLYGAEIWGWKEREKIEKLQDKYIRWTLGLDWRTPAYLVREEVKWGKLRTGTGRRAWRYEEKLRKGRGRAGEEMLFFEERGFSAETIEVRRVMELDIVEEMARTDKDIQKQEREEKMKGSKYNEGYMRIKTETVSKYLKEGDQNSEIQTGK